MVKLERDNICESQIVVQEDPCIPPVESSNSVYPPPVSRSTYVTEADAVLRDAASALIAAAAADRLANQQYRARARRYSLRAAHPKPVHSSAGNPGRVCAFSEHPGDQVFHVSSRKRRADMMDDNVGSQMPREGFKSDTGGVSGEEVDIEADHSPEEHATARRLFGGSVDSPPSPNGGFKRMRSSAGSDACSSSIRDMDDICYMDMEPDSVPAMVSEIKKLLDYVASKPSLYSGSASFMRDYLRTLLTQSSIAAAESIQATNKTASDCFSSSVDGSVSSAISSPAESFSNLPDELAKHIFSFLDGKNLAVMRGVCRKWNELACEDDLWRVLVMKKWRSLDTDPSLWRIVFHDIGLGNPTRWRQVYPKVMRSIRWKCRLMKTGRFICNLSAHQISGTPLDEHGLPQTLIVERRFNMAHLRTFILPDSSVLFFEPLEESDRVGFKDFIDYLTKRTRAGLALEEQRRFIFIPPCEYLRSQVQYDGPSLVGVVQNAYPPLAPAQN